MVSFYQDQKIANLKKITKEKIELIRQFEIENIKKDEKIKNLNNGLENIKNELKQKTKPWLV